MSDHLFMVGFWWGSGGVLVGFWWGSGGVHSDHSVMGAYAPLPRVIA